MTQLCLIAAMDKNNLIGNNNDLPWHLPADLAFFKRTTLGKPIIMGRKTFESIGRALPGRRNIVVTRAAQFSAEGCDVVGSIDTALDLCRDEAEAMLIGGASLYRQSIDRANCMYITRIDHEFSGDTWFPRFDESEWKVEDRQDFAADSRNNYPYSFIKFVREF